MLESKIEIERDKEQEKIWCDLEIRWEKHFLWTEFTSLLDYIWCTIINLFDPKTFSLEHILSYLLPMPIFKIDYFEKMGLNLGWVKEH